MVGRDGSDLREVRQRRAQSHSFGDGAHPQSPQCELKELTPKEPVADLIEKARIDKEARNKLIEKYIYVVEDQTLNIKGIDKEELKADCYLKLVELVNKYFEINIEYPLSMYLITQMKDFCYSYQKQEKERKINVSKYEVIEEYAEDITNSIINNMYLMHLLKNADLKERQEIILKYAIGYGVEYRELGQNYGVTKSRAQQIAQSGIERIRKKNNIH